MWKAKQIGSLALTVAMLMAMIGCGPVEPADTTPPAATEPELQGQLTEPTTPSTAPSSTPTEPQQPSDPTAPVQPTEPPATVPVTIPPNTVPVETVPPVTEHIHSYDDIVVPPTCTTSGYTKHTCACGTSYTDSSTSPTGHNWGRWSEPEEIADSQDKAAHRTCSICGEMDTAIIPCVETNLELWEPATQKEAEIARLFLDYINQFRADEGSTQLTYLPGMSQVAQYRSRQLVTNLAHDTKEMREAAAYYQYGIYIDWAEHGCPERVDQNYYQTNTQEAVGMTNLIGTSEQIAYELATACHNSAGHWRYVGSSDNSLSGVGVACVEGGTYLCIMVGKTNYG